METFLTIIAGLSLIGLLILVAFYFKRQQQCKLFLRDVRDRKTGMMCYYFVNEERHKGTILKGYNGTSDCVPIQTLDGHKITRYVDEIYPLINGR